MARHATAQVGTAAPNVTTQNIAALDFLKPYFKTKHRKLYEPFGMMTSMLVSSPIILCQFL